MLVKIIIIILICILLGFLLKKNNFSNDTIILSCIIILLLLFRSNSLENFTPDEILQNIGKLYNEENLKVKNITATGNITNNNITTSDTTTTNKLVTTSINIKNNPIVTSKTNSYKNQLVTVRYLNDIYGDYENCRPFVSSTASISCYLFYNSRVYEQTYTNMFVYGFIDLNNKKAILSIRPFQLDYYGIHRGWFGLRTISAGGHAFYVPHSKMYNNYDPVTSGHVMRYERETITSAKLNTKNIPQWHDLYTDSENLSLCRLISETKNSSENMYLVCNYKGNRLNNMKNEIALVFKDIVLEIG